MKIYFFTSRPYARPEVSPGKENTKGPKHFHNPEKNGSGGFIEEDDSDPGRDGGEQGPHSIQGPMRPPSHPTQQVPPSRVLPSLEMRDRTPRLREMRVRARHGEDAADAEDP